MEGRRGAPEPRRPLRIFGTEFVPEALAWSSAGGLALHVHDTPKPDATCCMDAVARGETIAHLFFHDGRLLEATLALFGIRPCRLHGVGSKTQHVDLCGAALDRAREIALS